MKNDKRPFVALGRVRLLPLLLLLCVTIIAGAGSAVAAASSHTDEDAVVVKNVETTHRKPFTLRVTGRLRVDGAIVNAGQTPLEDRGELSSARLGLSGTIGRHWRYATSYEFSGEDPAFETAMLSYTGLRDTTIKLGLQREPFGLEQASSTRLIPFIERALPEALAPGYSLGTAIQTGGKYWSATVGLFWDEDGSDLNRFHRVERGMTGRFTVAPRVPPFVLLDTLHLGLSTTYREPDARQKIRFRAEPESELVDVKFIDTRTIADIDRYTGTNIEGAVAHGPLSLQGEVTRISVMRKNAREELEFAGGYVYASWRLTGESRAYNAKIGSFERIKPKRKFGALELALRYSTLNLNDALITDGIRGGKQSNITAGLNWHLNSQWRFMVNYIWVTAHARQGDERPQMLLGRAQFEF